MSVRVNSASLGAQVRDMNAGKLGLPCPRPDDPCNRRRESLTVPPPLESVMQTEMERWLTERGYLRLTVRNLDAVADGERGDVRGFWGHWSQCEGNPIMPDLLIVSWPEKRPPLFLEIKSRQVYQPGQKAAISCGLWRVAFAVDDAIAVVEEWEGEGD